MSKKIIHYVGSLEISSGGITNFLRCLTTETKKYLDVRIATSKSAHPLMFHDIDIHFFNMKLYRWFQLKQEFEIYLKKEFPDWVHIHGIWNPQNYLFQQVAKELSIPVVISLHGMLEPWILRRNSIKKKIALRLYQKKALNDADLIHLTAKQEKVNFLNLGCPTKFKIIPIGISQKEIPAPKTTYGQKKIIFLSRLHPKKGIELLLNAWKKLNPEDWTLTIVGEGDPDYEKSLFAMAKGFENILFIGPRYEKQKWDILKSADLMILPTYSENFAIVVAEALSVGVPVITTQGTPWEDLEQKKCGWWIELNEKKLKETLRQAMLLSPSELKQMGENGIQLIQDKYLIDHQISKFIKLYE